MATQGLPVRTSTAERLERGRLLFNSGRFFEAHEEWEEAWRAEKGANRRLLQGLIQIAAGFHKGLVQKRPSGCVRLLEAGLSRLGGSAPSPFAIDAFAAGVEKSLTETRRWLRGEAGALAPESVPRLALQTSVESS